MKKISILLIIFITISSIVFAHSGRTDSNGGHYDRSTGEYHYHNGGSTLTLDITKEDSELEEQILELQSQKENLEEEVYNLEQKINEYNSELQETGFNTIEDISKKLSEKENEISNLWLGFIITFIIGIIVAYNIGSSRNQNK